MKITMTFLVRNEEDIIRQNILFHHAQGIDSFIVMDNLSTDGTASIVKELSRNIDIEYIYQPQDDYSQSEWVTDMARRACIDHHADWVINNDADEFWRAGTGTIRDIISGADEDVGVMRLRRHNAVLQFRGRDPLSGEAHPETSEFFERFSINNAGLPLPRKCIHRASASALVAQGNHGVEGVSGRTIDVDDHAYVLHYPYRTLDHYKRKVRLGGAAYARNTKLSPDVGITWREHYKLLDTQKMNEFWKGLGRSGIDVLIDVAEGKILRDAAVIEALRENRRKHESDVLQNILHRLQGRTEVEVNAFIASQIELLTQFPEEERRNRPLYHNLDFCLNGPQRHLERVRDLKSWGSKTNLCRQFSQLRDIFSLFPRNVAFSDFLGDLLKVSNPGAAEKLRNDCDGRPVILHVSCMPRLHLAERSVQSFDEGPGSYHHIIVLGTEEGTSEDETELCLKYDGRILTVPVPDDYENLHRKIFYALTLIHLVADPSCIAKIDDNLVLGDAVRFDATLSSLISGSVEYAGRLIGSRFHQSQWHGWHVDKCRREDVEERGYQYPLPRKYAAGGYGYVLGRKGIAACAYMYLAMKEFFSLNSVGLEDAYVGHAMYASDIELHNVSSEEHLLSLPGLSSVQTVLS